MAEVKVKAAGVLFDMDGVLISSIEGVRRSWRKWAAYYGVPGAETLEIPHGTRASELVGELAPWADAGEALRLVEELELADVEGLEVLPGARELLASLPVERWAIVTSATRRLLLRRLEVAKLPVPVRLVSGDDVGRGKPDAEPYLRGAAIVGAAAKDCVVVEDAPAGVKSGKAAGCRVLGVLGTHSPEELKAAGADWVVASLVGMAVDVVEGGVELGFSAV